MSNASRFDKPNPKVKDSDFLLTSTGGHVINDFALRPELNLMQCDIITVDSLPPEFLPDTRCILILGEHAMHQMLPNTRLNSLNELRGSPFTYKGIPTICSFFPQDAADIKDYEGAYNQARHNHEVIDERETEDDEESATKKHGKTKRRNYAFWIKSDCDKVKYILKHGTIPIEPEPIYKTYINSQEIISVLLSRRDSFLYLDIETDREEANMQCFSFSFGDNIIYNVPVLNNEYKPAYSSLHKIIWALAISISRNTLIAYNGANFDYLVFGYKYGIPVYKVYDPMVAFHRCFPDVEKSLGHVISKFTWQQFHKDENSEAYRTREQMLDRMLYCGKDVHTMVLIHRAIENYANTIVGLHHSISTAQSHIVPYLTTTLQGISFNDKKRKELIKHNDRWMMQLNRIIKILIGPSAMKEIQDQIKGKAKSFAGSNTQCAYYFHDMMGYAVVNRSDKTGKPSLGKVDLFKIALANGDNPVIRLVVQYRLLGKETGDLSYIPWKDDSGKIVNPHTYELEIS